MKKVSIITLSLVMLMNGSIAFSAPRKVNKRRNASMNMNPTSTSIDTTNVSTEVGLDTRSEVKGSLIIEGSVYSAEERSVFIEGVTDLGVAVNSLQQKINDVKNSCSGIKKDLDSIFGLNVATTVVSGVGTLASGGALVTGIMKAKTDKKIEKLKEIKKLRLSIENLGNDPNTLPKQVSSILQEMEKWKEELSDEEEQALEKKSKTLGNVRTGLMAGSIATSAASMGTSIASSVNAKKLAEKMKDCNTAIDNLKVAKSKFVSDMDDLDIDFSENASYIQTTKILDVCKGYDNDNIKQVKNMSTASTVVGGIGTATSIAGTITSAFANSNKVRNGDGDEAEKKEKDLNLASNIMAGITTGTSGTSTVLSAISISKAKKDSDMAEKCENILK